jgi:hypothetical protein
MNEVWRFVLNSHDAQSLSLTHFPEQSGLIANLPFPDAAFAKTIADKMPNQDV